MNGSAIEPITRGGHPVRSKAAAAAGFTGFAVFQLALALGAPLGRAMGGAHTYLPGGLRMVSALAVLIWLLAALVVLRRGGYTGAADLGQGRSRRNLGADWPAGPGRAPQPRLAQRLGALPAGRGPQIPQENQ